MIEVMSVCVVMRRVWPSGAARATSSPAIWLLAPGRFSTNMVWPRASPVGAARRRAVMSVAPPAVKPTSILIGFTGNLGAWAHEPAATARQSVPTIQRIMVPPRIDIAGEGYAHLMAMGYAHCPLPIAHCERGMLRTMKHRIFGRTGIKVSEVVFGA